MRRHSMILAGFAIAALGACSRTESGDVVIKRPADVDVKTTLDTIRMPQIGTKTDTINAPVVGTKRDTIIITKPVVGTEKKQVKVPEVKRP